MNTNKNEKKWRKRKRWVQIEMKLSATNLHVITLSSKLKWKQMHCWKSKNALKKTSISNCWSRSKKKRESSLELMRSETKIASNWMKSIDWRKQLKLQTFEAENVNCSRMTTKVCNCVERHRMLTKNKTKNVNDRINSRILTLILMLMLLMKNCCWRKRSLMLVVRNRSISECCYHCYGRKSVVCFN